MHDLFVLRKALEAIKAVGLKEEKMEELRKRVDKVVRENPALLASDLAVPALDESGDPIMIAVMEDGVPKVEDGVPVSKPKMVRIGERVMEATEFPPSRGVQIITEFLLDLVHEDPQMVKKIDDILAAIRRDLDGGGLPLVEYAKDANRAALVKILSDLDLSPFSD